MPLKEENMPRSQISKIQKFVNKYHDTYCNQSIGLSHTKCSIHWFTIVVVEIEVERKEKKVLCIRSMRFFSQKKVHARNQTDTISFDKEISNR